MPQLVQTLKSLSLGGLVGGVPALHDLVELVGPLICGVAAEPHGFDQAAALRRWCLLVLAGKLYSPIVRRTFARITTGWRSGCNASPRSRVNTYWPSSLSSAQISSSSVIDGKRTT